MWEHLKTTYCIQTDCVTEGILRSSQLVEDLVLTAQTSAGFNNRGSPVDK